MKAAWMRSLSSFVVGLGGLLCSTLSYGAPSDGCGVVDQAFAPQYSDWQAQGWIVTTKIGAPVKAVMGGTVEAVHDGSDVEPWTVCNTEHENTKEVTILHGDIRIRYGMLFQLAEGLKEGDKLTRGTVIGMAGMKSHCVREADPNEGIVILQSTTDLSDLADVGDCPCVPNCDDRVCGTDGCGGTCGFCANQSFCQEGQCVCRSQNSSDPDQTCGGDGCGSPLTDSGFLCPDNQSCQNNICVKVEDCVPHCSAQARECGNDGCGGSCGECLPHEVCVNYQCVCAPKCEGRACGDDGCGGSCGSCKTGVCDDSGQCVCEVNGEIQRTTCSLTPEEPQPCKAKCYTGASSGNPSGGGTASGKANCVIDCTSKTCGESDGCGGICGTCPEGDSCQVKEGQYVCMTLEMSCIPQCDERQCGNDGCGGICGSCGNDYACISGICEFGALPEIEIRELEGSGCQMGTNTQRLGGFGACLLACLGILVCRRKSKAHLH